MRAVGNLARVLKKQGRYEDAVPYSRRLNLASSQRCHSFGGPWVVVRDVRDPGPGALASRIPGRDLRKCSMR